MNISKVDAYSLGCCLFKLFHGRSPFRANVTGLTYDQQLDKFRGRKKTIASVPWNSSISIELKSLILSLIEFYPVLRMLLEEIMDHEWCKNYK